MSMKAILEAITLTAEMTQTQLSETARVAMAERLLAYPLTGVMKALNRCCDELRRGQFTFAEVMNRLATSDGRLSADEAWGVALLASDEAETVVWTDEIAKALDAAKPILAAGDEVAARMAFKAAYEREITEARTNGVPAKWWPSVGHDKARRTAALEKAVTAGLLSHSKVAHLLPQPEPTGDVVALLTGKAAPSAPETAREQIAILRARLTGREGHA